MGQLAEVGDQMKETLFERQSERLSAQQTAHLYTHRTSITARTQHENVGRLSFL